MADIQSKNIPRVSPCGRILFCHVDPSLCTGCEKVCPVQDQPSVHVTNVGEIRSRTNVILLEGESYNHT